MYFNICSGRLVRFIEFFLNTLFVVIIWSAITDGLTWKLQEVGFVAEDQVIIGNEVEEPDIQLVSIVTLWKKKQKTAFTQLSHATGKYWNVWLARVIAS